VFRTGGTATIWPKMLRDLLPIEASIYRENICLDRNRTCSRTACSIPTGLRRRKMGPEIDFSGTNHAHFDQYDAIV
jgi:hypothetical protein